jgi:hypothetical protein
MVGREIEGVMFEVDIPSKESPGYMRRMMRLAELSEALSGGFTPTTLRGFLSFLALFVHPADGSDPIEALMDLSEAGLKEVQELVVKGSAEPPKAVMPSP